jgi:hypothetical protein
MHAPSLSPTSICATVSLLAESKTLANLSVPLTLNIGCAFDMLKTGEIVWMLQIWLEV